MRAFIAIPLPPAVTALAVQLQDRLRTAGHGSFPPPENLHLTLAFIGEIPEEREAALAAAMQAVPMKKMHLATGEVGRFDQREGGTVYLAVRPDPALLSYRAALCASVRAAGFAIDEKAFIPHITLARKAALPPGGIKAEAAEFDAAKTVLYESRQIPGRRIYRAAARSGAQKDIDSAARDANNFHEKER